jgi:hypothetical protein
LAVTQLADGIVLAKKATACTARKEDGPRTPRAADGWFLPRVKIPARHADQVVHAADACLAVQAIHAATMRAELTGCQQRDSVVDAPGQLSGAI